MKPIIKWIKAMAFALAVLTFASPAFAQSKATVDQRYDPAFVKAHVIPKKTTQAEIAALFGKPHEDSKESITNGNSSLEWRWHRKDEGAYRSARRWISKAAELIPQAHVSNVYGAERKVDAPGNYANKVKDVAGIEDRRMQHLSIEFINGVVTSYGLW